jgi:1,4-alpha-glucan branching enzyme
MLYAFSENFQLPLSHDEVVHGKRSLVAKMPGDSWQRHANLRLLYAWQFTYPGTKLLFMGGEFAQEREWSHARSLDWERLEDPLARGTLALLSDLNALYRDTPALHANDFEPEGFRWIDCHDAAHAALSYVRLAGAQYRVVVLNFTPVVRRDYRIGVPCAGEWLEVLNTDSRHYGGTDVGNGGRVLATAIPHLGEPYSISLTLPPLGAVLLAPVRD